jgi:replicative DNA helicase
MNASVLGGSTSAPREPTSGQDAAKAHKAPELPRMMRLADLLGEVEADARAAHEARISGKPRGPVTGLKKVDAELNGALPIGTTVVLGNTGAGKTAFAWQVATNCQFPALFVSCEMSPAELLRRHAANVTGQYLNRFKSGEMTPEAVLSYCRQAVEAAPLLWIVDATRAPATANYLREVAETARGDARQILIVVDSLHSWSRGVVVEAANEYEVLGEALDELRTLAHALQSPILMISEQNRAGMKEGGANSGAGHRSIEYGAETVLDLVREKDVQPDGAGEVPVTLRFGKNRNGAAGKTVALKFNGALMCFREA